jgi:DNA polymerase-1
MMNSGKKPLLIIDGYGFIFRAYHVQPPLTSPAGIPVGAIYGFTSMLVKLINDFKPEHAVIVLDHSGKNFRHDIYKDYKANRPPAPDDLVVQLKLVEKAAKALNFICLSKQGFEADDIIATLAKKATQIQMQA